MEYIYHRHNVSEALQAFDEEHRRYSAVVVAYGKAEVDLPTPMAIPRLAQIHLNRLNISDFFMFVHKKGRLNNYVVVDIEKEEIYLESRGKASEIAMKAYQREFAIEFIEQILESYVITVDNKPYYKTVKDQEGKDDIVFYHVGKEVANSELVTYSIPQRSSKVHYAYTIYDNTFRVYLVYQLYTSGSTATKIIKAGQKDLDQEEYDSILQHSESALENNEFDPSIFTQDHRYRRNRRNW